MQTAILLEVFRLFVRPSVSLSLRLLICAVCGILLKQLNSLLSHPTLCDRLCGCGSFFHTKDLDETLMASSAIKRHVHRAKVTDTVSPSNRRKLTEVNVEPGPLE